MLSDENTSAIIAMLKRLREAGKTETEIKEILKHAGFIESEIESIINLNSIIEPQSTEPKQETQTIPLTEPQTPQPVLEKTSTVNGFSDSRTGSEFDQSNSSEPVNTAEEKDNPPEQTNDSPEQNNNPPEQKKEDKPPLENKISEPQGMAFSPPPLDKKVFGNESEKDIPKDNFLKDIHREQRKNENPTPGFILDSSSTHTEPGAESQPGKYTVEKTEKPNTLEKSPNPVLQQNTNSKAPEDPFDSYKKREMAFKDKNKSLNKNNFVKIGLIAVVAVVILGAIAISGLLTAGADTENPALAKNAETTEDSQAKLTLEIESNISLADFFNDYKPKMAVRNNSENIIESDIYSLYIDENHCSDTLSTVKEIKKDENLTLYFNNISQACQFADNPDFDMSANHEIKITSPNGVEIIQSI